MKNRIINALLLTSICAALMACNQAENPIAPAAVEIASVSMTVGDTLDIYCEAESAQVTQVVTHVVVSCLAGALPAETATEVVVVLPSATDTPQSTDTATFTPTFEATATETLTPVPADTATITPTWTATIMPTNSATVTPVPPTATNTPTLTPTKVTPPTPAAQLTPFAAAPLCATHDDRYWHSLWNSDLGCHYDHQHGADPNHPIISNYIVSDGVTMGSMRELQGGVDYGYVWQTTAENAGKHKGYNSQTAINLSCEQQNYTYIFPASRKCIKAFDITFHIDHGTREGTSRFHSFSGHVIGCERDGLSCGDIFTGGISDTGDIHAPYKTNCVEPLGSNRPPCPSAEVWQYQVHNPPYWAYVVITDALKVLNNGDLARNDLSKHNLPSNRIIWENYSSDRTPLIGNREGLANLRLHINARTYNGSTYYNPMTRKFEYVCHDASCSATNDAVYIYAVAFEVPSNLPMVNGFVNYTGYTDRAGRVVTTCTVPGVECVPLRIRNLKPGLYIYDMTAPFIPSVRTWGDGAITDGVRYFDTTPPGVPCAGNPSKTCSWIKLPTALGE